MPWHRLLWTLVAVLAVAAALSGVADESGQQHAAKAFQRALVTFAIARTLNGVISVAQGTELAIEPGGIGMVFTLGQILDPINDLVERFSTVMLVATSSIGLQTILLSITAWWGTTLVLTIFAGYAVIALWWKRLDSDKPRSLAVHLLLIAIFVRFAVPLLVIGTNSVFETFLVADQVAATEALESTRDQIEQLNEESRPPMLEDQSFVDRLSSMLDESLSSVNPREQLDRLRERVADSVEQIIDLIVIFIFQTIILPLAFLWLIIQLFKSLGERATRL